MRPATLAHHLPRHDIRVVLHRADDDLVASGDEGFASGRCDEVDGLRSTTGEDKPFGRGRSDEVSDTTARSFVVLGRDLAEVVHTTMDVGIGRIIGLLDGLNDAARLLSGRSIVEVNEGLTIDLRCEYRELGSYIFYRIHDLIRL